MIIIVFLYLFSLRLCRQHKSRTQPNLNLDCKLKFLYKNSPHNHIMGKKVAYSLPKPRKEQNRQYRTKQSTSKQYSINMSILHHEHSPISKNSDTAIFYGDSEESQPTSSKPTDLRKADAMLMLSGS